jgi:putative transposase
MQGFKSTPHAQRALSTHAAIGDAFVFQRHMIKRPTLGLFRGVAGSVWEGAAT